MKTPYLLTAFFIVISVCASGQVTSLKNLFQQPKKLSKDFHTIASSYQSLELDPRQLQVSRNIANPAFSLSLPFENKEMQLDLTPASITSPRFSVVEGMAGGGTRKVAYELPSFFQGKIKGADHSIAAVSFFQHQVIGVLSDAKSNIILGAIENKGQATNQYALYRDIDLKVNSGINCFADEMPVPNIPKAQTLPSPGNRELAIGQPVEIYFECDYKFYQDKGSNINNVVNYVLGFFNSVALIYANENIQVQVSQIKVWTTPDPYAGLTTTSAVLSSFAANMGTDPYVGDYAHFLSTRSLGGGVAYLLSNPCASARGNRSGVSAIDNTYKNFPVYSWTVNVVTHELGHNFGSHHTHWCGWPGGPIDWCAPTANASYIEGTCTTGPLPAAGGGTIMSYCHLLGSVGINLSNGFGPLPGAAIRTAIGSGTCFGNCKMTLTHSKVDASCGQNNGSATIVPANGTGVYSYLWNNGQTAATLTNAAPGIYNVTVTDAAGCKLLAVDTIVNAGATLPATLTPSGTASFCTGNTLLLSATNNPAYTYQWFNNNVAITTATQPTYLAAIAGAYSVEVSAGSCTVTKSVTVTQVTQPSASITTAGSPNLCSGNTVLLSANPSSGYQYQWYKDGTAISTATTNSYTAGTAGNYTVRVFAGTCESTSSAIVVSVVSSPAATISSGGPLSFCDGGALLLTSNSVSGYTYQWYQNNTIITGATQSTYNATTGGSYTVTNSLGTCSKTSAAVVVTVLPNPTIIIAPDSVTIQKFQSQTLLASGASSYNLSVQPAIVSSTTNSIVVKPLSTTIYTIEGTAKNGCKGTGTARIEVIGCGEVTMINATAYSPSRTVITWTNPSDVTGDSIQYRIKGSQEWTTVYSATSEFELDGLMPGMDYEYRITALCSNTVTFIPSGSFYFKTPALSSGIYLKLFPNPVLETGKLEIIVAKDYTLQVDLFDMVGRKVMAVIPTGHRLAGQTLQSISAIKLPAGLYHLVIHIDGKLYTLKMVVQR